MSDNKIQSINEFLTEDAVKQERAEILDRLQWIADNQSNKNVVLGVSIAIALIQRRGLVPVPPPEGRI